MEFLNDDFEYNEDAYLGELSPEDDEKLSNLDRGSIIKEEYVGSIYDYDLDFGEDSFSDDEIDTLDDIFGS